MKTLPLLLLASVMGNGLLLMAAPPSVIGATAVAVVAVTIAESRLQQGELALSTAYVDLRGKVSEELAIINHSGGWHEFRAELTPRQQEDGDCTVHYSPKQAVIPPGGTQILRLLVKQPTQRLCQIQRQMVISNPLSPATPALIVDIDGDSR